MTNKTHGGGLLKFLSHDHTRDYPYRGKQREEKSGEKKNYTLRFCREYLWPYRWLLLATVLVMGLNTSGSYCIAALNRYVVDNILVVTDTNGRPTPAYEKMGSRGAQRRDHSIAARNPPAESQGRRIARGIRLSRRPVEAGKALLLLAMLYVATHIFFNLLSRHVAKLEVTLMNKVQGRLREDMHKKVLELSLSYQQKMSPGRLLSRIISDTGAVRNEIAYIIELLVRIVGLAGIGTGILLVSEWRVLVVLLLTMPFFVIIKRHYVPKMHFMQREQRFTNGALYGLISQKMDAIKAVKSYGQQDAEALNFRRLSSVYIRDASQVQWRYKVMGFLSWLALHFANCAVFLFGGYLVTLGEMSLGKLVFLRFLTQLFFQPVSDFTEMTFTNQDLQVALGRCYGVLDVKPEITEDPDAVDFPKPLAHGIHIKDLSYHYNDGEKDAGKDVLSGVNLDVPAGEWLCIMGASGTGKSTLLHLLARLYTPTKGSIDYDGVPLEKIRFASLRTSLGVVPQEAQIFSGSVRDNIAYGNPEATNQQIIKAAQDAAMHDFILEMPVQYETLIGEKGQSLSGGQRQRLSLARALLCEPEVLLLDDCTSALDANTERKIQETLMTQLAGKTAVIVSQRVSMAVRCNHIAVLENGRVTEYGTHQELLEKKGFYETLFQEQTK